MIIYRPQERLIETQRALRLSDSALEALISFGELEAGVVDAVAPDCEIESMFRDAAMALGRWFYRASCGIDASEARRYFEQKFAAIQRLTLPSNIRTSVPEGYAFYGLYPQAYIEASHRFVEERRPSSVCVIGIRSIGTSLSAVVSGSLAECGCAIHSFTVRPDGHPFDRQVRFDFELPTSAQFFAIVDEGPGLSGSSFISVATKLRECGVSPDRIVLFPAWAGDASRFVNDRARAEWPMYAKYCVDFDRRWTPVDASATDISAGEWRRQLGCREAAVQPQHEARKYLAGDRLWKFEGLAQYGNARFDRAVALAGAGFGPKAESFAEGFVRYRVETRARVDSSPPIAQYLTFRSLTFSGQRSLSFDELLEMVSVNTAEGLGRDASARKQNEANRNEFNDRPAVAVDGRMLPHEWISTDSGWLKADSVDHCGDHFFPGNADIAWDLAGAVVEFGFTPDQRDGLLREYAKISGDCPSPALLQFYETAYLAFRLAYTKMAADSLSGTPEEPRFRALQHAYASRVTA